MVYQSEFLEEFETNQKILMDEERLHEEMLKERENQAEKSDFYSTKLNEQSQRFYREIQPIDAIQEDEEKKQMRIKEQSERMSQFFKENKPPIVKINIEEKQRREQLQKCLIQLSGIASLSRMNPLYISQISEQE